MSKLPDTDLVKLYYRIGEVSRIVGVQPHVLRYWESEFRTIRPQKSNKGQRVYSRRDVEKLLRVKDLLKNQGFTIAGAKRRLREPAGGAETAGRAEVALEPARDAMPPTGGKSLRKELVLLRQDIVSMLAELDSTGGRPDIRR